MKLFILALAIMSTQAFAQQRKDLTHLDVVDLNSLHTSEVFSVQYPGMGEGRGDNPDCLILSTNKKYVDRKKLERLAKGLHLADGYIVLGDNGPRHGGQLDPVITSLNDGRKSVIKYYLKDLGKYVTSVSIRSFSPYISIGGVITTTLGRGAKAKLQFFRGCKL